MNRSRDADVRGEVLGDVADDVRGDVRGDAEVLVDGEVIEGTSETNGVFASPPPFFCFKPPNTDLLPAIEKWLRYRIELWSIVRTLKSFCAFWTF